MLTVRLITIKKGKHHYKKSNDKKSLYKKSASKGKDNDAKRGLPDHLSFLKGDDSGDSDHPKFFTRAFPY